jgi:hypothetical protein
MKKVPVAPVPDIRCPHCKIVILKKERIDTHADLLRAPEFCPRCGERTEPEPAGAKPTRPG